MGEHLLSVTIMTLTLVLATDFFDKWYARFLERFGATPDFKKLLRRIFWVVLAFTFWFTLLHKGMPEEFTIGHFAFTLFIFSVYGLIRSLIRKQ